MRIKQNHTHGSIGVRASHFTEGGYCTLFREGMRFGHMIGGIVGLNDEPLSDRDFELMTDLVQEQLRARVKMRNEEFSFPLTNERVEGIYNGDINPKPFDFEKAEARIDHG